MDTLRQRNLDQRKKSQIQYQHFQNAKAKRPIHTTITRKPIFIQSQQIRPYCKAPIFKLKQNHQALHSTRKPINQANKKKVQFPYTQHHSFRIKIQKKGKIQRDKLKLYEALQQTSSMPTQKPALKMPIITVIANTRNPNKKTHSSS